MRNKWTILLANTYDGSTNGSLRLAAYPHAHKKKETQTDRNNHDNVIETVKWSSHKSVVRPALVKLQLIGAWWFKAPVVVSSWQAAHLSCHLKSEPDAVICAVPVIIQTTRQWMWLYKNMYIYILFLRVLIALRMMCHSDWATVALFFIYHWAEEMLKDRDFMCWELRVERLHVTLLFGEGSLGEFSCFEEVTQGRTELTHWLSLPLLCGKKPPALHAAIPPQCHRNQSSWHDHVCQVALWRTCINYKGKHLEAVLYSIFDLLHEEGVSFGSKWLFWLHKSATHADKRSFPVKVLILPPLPFTICCIHIQPVHDPSIPTHLSAFPANDRWLRFFFPT